MNWRHGKIQLGPPCLSCCPRYIRTHHLRAHSVFRMGAWRCQRSSRSHFHTPTSHSSPSLRACVKLPQVIKIFQRELFVWRPVCWRQAIDSVNVVNHGRRRRTFGWEMYSRFVRGPEPDSARAAHALHHAVRRLRKQLEESGKPPFILFWVPFIHIGIWETDDIIVCSVHVNHLNKPGAV